MLKTLSPALLFILTGCAASATGIMKTNVEMTLDSTKTPQSWASCAAEAFLGNSEIRNDGEHYWVLRKNMYGMPVHRWDFYPKADGGARAELRSTWSANTGDEKVKACA